MLFYKTAVAINRPKEQVFSYMTQLENGDQLMDEVLASKNITEGAVGLGTQMAERVKWGPAREDLIWEITAFEANRLCTFEADTSFGRTQVSYLFESNEGGHPRCGRSKDPIEGVVSPGPAGDPIFPYEKPQTIFSGDQETR